MNLIVFTPAAKKSAIGRMTALVTQELAAKGHRVTVVRTETEALLSTGTHDFGVPVLPWNDSAKLAKIIQGIDACIYQIGDNYEYHQGALHWLPSLPGLVCLHDFFLGHLFWGWAQSRRAEASEVLRSFYGVDVAEQFFGYATSEAFIEGTRDVSPTTEWICSMADAVITHSNWGCQRVLNSCPGPVRVVSLAYDAPGAVTSIQPGGQSKEDENIQLLTIGHVNPNKRIESVIKAIANSPLLKQCVTYRLVGHVTTETATSLSTLARELDVRLVISGEVDDTALSLALAESDVISCLRWPSLEAASASAIESLLYGKPVIVTDTGFYAEIPDEYVLKVSPKHEISELKSILERLVKDRGLCNTIGSQAQQWATRTFTAENYGAELMETVMEMVRVRPILGAVNFFTVLIDRWGGDFDAAGNKQLINTLQIFEH